VDFRNAESDCHNRQHDRVQGIVLGQDGHDAGIPSLGKQLWILPADEDDSLRFGQGEGQSSEREFVQDQYAG
jgi:hypothetical protein